MRLSCPGCGAVYEAPIASVGPAGRLVECGACGRRWRAFAAEGEASAPDAPPSPAPALPVFAPATGAAPARGTTRAEPGPAPGLPAVQPAIVEFEADEPARSGGAFMAGFALVASAALIALVIYARHDGLIAAAPALADPLTVYADWVDARRADLRDAVDALRGRIGG
jgi:predicted Zn finger-like uncharacterized protein